MVTHTQNVEKYVVAQSNELVEAMYSPALTARAHKVARLIFSLISPDDKDLKLYTITVEALKKYLGFKEDTTWGRFHEDLKDIAERLNKEPIIIKTSEEVITAYLIAAYAINLSKATVTFEIPLLLKPFLIELKRNFTKYPLLYIPKLRSAYSIRLYELLYQYKTIGHRTIELDVLQRQVGSDYDLYGDFKRKVLSIAQRDLEEHTDIKFDYEEIKTVRKVTGLRFTIVSNVPQKDRPKTPQSPQTVLNFLENAVEVTDKQEILDATKQRLLDIGISAAAAAKYLNLGFNIIKDGEKRVLAEARCATLEAYYLEKMTLLQQSAAAIKANPAGFFIKALQEDWQSSAVVHEQQERNEKKKRQTLQAQIKKLEAEREQLKRSWSEAKTPIFDQIMAENTEGYAQLFADVRANAGSMRDTIFPPKMSPNDVFQKGGMAQNLLKIKMEEQFPKAFTAVNERFQTELTALDRSIADLKKRVE